MQFGMQKATVDDLRSEQLVNLAIEFQIQRIKSSVPNVEDNPFFVADLGQVTRQHRRWKLNLPNVQPFYVQPAVKCNSDPLLLRALAELGTGFDCASIEEMRSVLALGVDPSRIIFANPCKPAAALDYAREAGILTTVFDNIDELETIHCYMPDAQLLLRIYANDASALINFGDKFGAPAGMTHALLKRAKELSLDVVGVSFHVGEYDLCSVFYVLSPFTLPQSPPSDTPFYGQYNSVLNQSVGTGANDLNSFRKAIQEARVVFNQAETLGFTMRIVDVGGGFQDKNFGQIASTIRDSLADNFPRTTRFIAEPGRFYTRSAYTLVCRVISRRRQVGEVCKDQPDMLYQNDGLYGNFMNCLMEKEIFHPILIPDESSLGHREVRPHRYTIWGPTCDGCDYVVRDATLRCEAKVRDWLVYKNMGAYTNATATRFNGFSSNILTLYVDSELSGQV
ncbi:ornithine decarboxylase [Aspergillus arachidicola]|uniref:Ornithine decarboxylase n=1 Tax=Aspergillus arachidicola TaxID=656916 RepID=A0A2G7FWP0_9EURO|nr:ornithine decarboxylase [Aspergillus arachidicola]